MLAHRLQGRGKIYNCDSVRLGATHCDWVRLKPGLPVRTAPNRPRRFSAFFTGLIDAPLVFHAAHHRGVHPCELDGTMMHFRRL